MLRMLFQKVIFLSLPIVVVMISNHADFSHWVISNQLSIGVYGRHDQLYLSVCRQTELFGTQASLGSDIDTESEDHYKKCKN